MTAAQPDGGADAQASPPAPATSPNGVNSPVPHPLEAPSSKPQPPGVPNHPPSSSTGATSSPSDTTTTTTNGDIESPHHPPASLPASPPPPPSLLATCRNACTAYFSKWRGGTDTPLAPEPLRQLAVSWLGALLVILLLAALDQHAGPQGRFDWLIASFGASAVLMFGLPAAKLSQPRNVVGEMGAAGACGAGELVTARDDGEMQETWTGGEGGVGWWVETGQGPGLGVCGDGVGWGGWLWGWRNAAGD